MSEQRDWLVWSYEHRAWWRPNRRGYTPEPTSAGLYTEQDARQIEAGANWFPPEGDARAPEINEQAVPLHGSVEPIETGDVEADRVRRLQLEEALRRRDALVEIVRDGGAVGADSFVTAIVAEHAEAVSGGEREALRAENERLRRALEEIDQMAREMPAAEIYGCCESGLWDAGQIARAALDDTAAPAAQQEGE